MLWRRSKVLREHNRPCPAACHTYQAAAVDRNRGVAGTVPLADAYQPHHHMGSERHYSHQPMRYEPSLLPRRGSHLQSLPQTSVLLLRTENRRLAQDSDAPWPMQIACRCQHWPNLRFGRNPSGPVQTGSGTGPDNLIDYSARWIIIYVLNWGGGLVRGLSTNLLDPAHLK